MEKTGSERRSLKTLAARTQSQEEVNMTLRVCRSQCERFLCIIHFSPMGTTIAPSLQIRKLRQTDIKCLAQGGGIRGTSIIVSVIFFLKCFPQDHVPSKWCSWQGSWLVPEPTHFPCGSLSSWGACLK